MLTFLFLFLPEIHVHLKKKKILGMLGDNQTQHIC